MKDNESLSFKLYGGNPVVYERHRHRYEVNPDVFKALEGGGMAISGRSPDGALAEMIELAAHPYFVACQFHPEFKSRPLNAHPLFRAFIKAALDHRAKGEQARRDPGAVQAVGDNGASGAPSPLA